MKMLQPQKGFVDVGDLDLSVENSVRCKLIHVGLLEIGILYL